MSIQHHSPTLAWSNLQPPSYLMTIASQRSCLAQEGPNDPYWAALVVARSHRARPIVFWTMSSVESGRGSDMFRAMGITFDVELPAAFQAFEALHERIAAFLAQESVR